MDWSCELIEPISSCERDKASSRSFRRNDEQWPLLSGDDAFVISRRDMAVPRGIEPRFDG